MVEMAAASHISRVDLPKYTISCNVVAQYVVAQYVPAKLWKHSTVSTYCACLLQVFARSMVEMAAASHVSRRLCDLEGRLPMDSVMSNSFLFWSTWRRQLSRVDTASELIPQVCIFKKRVFLRR